MAQKSLYIIESVGIGALPRSAGLAYLEANGQKLPKVIYPEIRVLTADKPTLNNTYYPEAALRGDPEAGTGLSSFTYPYPIPIIRDHVTNPGALGGLASETYGRVWKPAQFLRDARDGYVLAMPEITHPEAIEGVLSGRWLTVSLGSRAGSVRCTICDQELTENGCEHTRGTQYEIDGLMQTAYWSIQELKAKEVSFVLTPSDDQAGVLNPNMAESAGATQAFPRILAGDGRGVLDLATGARVEESVFLPKSEPRLHGFHSLGSLPPKEKPMPENEKPGPDARKLLSEERLRVTDRNVREQYKGEGRYLLMGYGHDHDVYLDANGDGASSWAVQSDPFGYYGGEDDTAVGSDAPPAPEGSRKGDHIHEVLGGVVRNSAGDRSHTHYLEPAHAAKEGAEAAPAADKVEDPANEPVTLGVLYLLPSHHPDYYKPDTAESVDEKTLTAKDRNKLPEASFCGPDRSFPANDKGHVRDGLARLAGSKLSSSQKASVKACLHRKGKAMGMTFSTEAAACAAKMVDAENRVELSLYPLPLDAEALVAVLAQVEQVPHTPSERALILGRLAAHSRSFLETADWQTRFGELEACEEGAPIEIAITAENFALLYSGFAVAAQMESVAEKLTGSQAAAETETAVAEATPEAAIPETDAAPAEATEAAVAPLVPAEIDAARVQAEVDVAEARVAKDLSGLNYDKQIERLKEAVAEATERAATESQRASNALAHSCAMLMKLLRKPAARGKSLEAVVLELAARSNDSLTDKLADLCVEYDEGGPTIATLPRLQDPTLPETEGETAGRVATPVEESELDPDAVFNGLPTGIKVTPLTELDLQEGEPSLYLHSPALANLFGITGDPAP